MEAVGEESCVLSPGILCFSRELVRGKRTEGRRGRGKLPDAGERALDQERFGQDGERLPCHPRDPLCCPGWGLALQDGRGAWGGCGVERAQVGAPSPLSKRASFLPAPSLGSHGPLPPGHTLDK